MRSVCAAALLLMVILCPAGQTLLTVNVTHDVYHAEEHSNATLIWIYPAMTNKSSLLLIIDIVHVKPVRTVFFYVSKTETELYPHEFYRGRVQCDLELAWTGRIECLFTDLRLNDTGTYLCVVEVDGDNGYKSCDLNVTAASVQPLNETSQPAKDRGRIGLYVGLSLFGGTTAALLIRYLTF